MYRGPDGKIIVVQIFDRKDTEEDHWGLTQSYFARYGRPQVGESGELIYETPNARVILFMGQGEEENKEFIYETINQHPSVIMSFRGHSFSLEYNFPNDIFQNAEHVMFIAGSCGSTGSVVNYMSANPDVDIRFITNSSTGRGMVTNDIVDELIRPRNGPIDMAALMEMARPRIERDGGDFYTIKTWETGEGLAEYVLNM
jgi:hypothetical protein